MAWPLCLCCEKERIAVSPCAWTFCKDGSASSYKDEYFDYNITVFIIFSADRMYSSRILQRECVEGGSSSQSLVSVSVVVCIFQLCSRTRDIDNELCLFYWRRIDRGYHQEGLIPLFMKGVLNAESYILHWHRTNKTQGRKLKSANATSASSSICHTILKILHLHSSNVYGVTTSFHHRVKRYSQIWGTPADLISQSRGWLLLIITMLTSLTSFHTVYYLNAQGWKLHRLSKL
jgi:hypothetical protein